MYMCGDTTPHIHVINTCDISGDTTTQHGSHVFDVKCRLCTGKTFKDKQPEVVKTTEQYVVLHLF